MTNYVVTFKSFAHGGLWSISISRDDIFSAIADAASDCGYSVANVCSVTENGSPVSVARLARVFDDLADRGVM